MRKAGSLGVRGSNPLSSTIQLNGLGRRAAAEGVNGRGPSFAAFASDYWAVVQQHVAPSTRATVAPVLRDLIDAFGNRRLAEVTPRDCAVWWSRVSASMAPATANHRLVRLRHLYRTAREWGLVAEDPTRLLRKARAAERTRRLRANERELLLAHASDALRGYILGALYTGLRRENLWRLRESDVDLGAGLIYIGRTKNGDPLTLPLHSQLREYLATRMTGDSTAPVFYPYRSPHEVTQSFRRLCRRLGIVDLHFHDLRHEVGSRLGDAFASQSLIMAVLGHRDVRSSARYVHQSTEAVRRAMESAL